MHKIAIFNYYNFHAILVCSMPFPSEMNAVLRFYLDWFDQLMFYEACFAMVCTTSLFFIGTCVYIGAMVDDLEQTLLELVNDSNTMMRALVTEIRFHNDILE